MTIAAASFFTALTPPSPIGAATPDAAAGQIGFGAVVDAAIAGLAAPATTGALASAAIPPTTEGAPPSANGSGAKADPAAFPPALPVAPPAVTIESPPVPPTAGPAPAITPAVATQPADASALSGKAGPAPTATKVVVAPPPPYGGAARVAERDGETPEADDEAAPSAMPASDAQTAAPAPVVPAPAAIPSPVEPMMVAPPMPSAAPATPPAPATLPEITGASEGRDWRGGSADPAPSARHTADRAPDREVGENRSAATGFADRLAAAAEPRVQQPTPAHAPGGPDLAAAQAPTQQPVAQTLAQQPAAAAAGAHQPVVNARPGRIGHEMGVEIARRVSIGGDELTVRLNPVEMGRIEVRLSFDERGSLRAVVAAESPAALDLLRRDSADLGRALADAGVRADAGSFRFDARSGGGEGGQFWQRQQDGGQRAAPGRGYAAAGGGGGDEEPTYRPLRTSGRIDLMA